MNKKEPEHKIIGGGLAELTADDRDFSHEQVFGSIRPDKLPEEDFMTAPILEIKDQGDSDLCTAYATTSASEDQEGVILDPNFTFFVTKVKIAKNPDAWGANLRDAMKSHVKYGGLEQEIAPLPRSAKREQILSLQIWDEDHMALAYEHRKNSFFNVIKDSPLDVFDTIRSALWMHRKNMRSVVTGAKWRPLWTDAEAGVILNGEYGNFGTPHAFVFKGQRTINGAPHLVAQLSNGEEIGEGGVFYFPREIVNQELGKYGAFMFVDMPREKAENYIYYRMKATDNILVKIWKVLFRMAADLFTNNKKVYGGTN